MARRTAALLAVALCLAAGCASIPDQDLSSATPSTADLLYSTAEYLPGLEADVHLPAGHASSGPVPVVLLVPGGGWTTADRGGLGPLAGALADAGFLAVNATYRAGAGVTFPTPVEDVLCASGFAVEVARTAGLEPGPVVVAGHSAGGHLAAVAALQGLRAAADCPHAVPTIDGLIGMAGVYDVGAFEFALVEFFGGPRSTDPETWRLGDPVGLADAWDGPAALRVLLLHGDADEVVPVDQSLTFEAALVRAGIPVRLDIVAEATHDSIYSPGAVAGPAITWIRDLSGG